MISLTGGKAMLLSLLKKRRSIRKYQPRPIEKEKIETLIESLLRSPSSRNLNPWQFIFVTEPGLLAKLGRSKEHGAGFLKGAALAVVLIADPERCDVWVEDCSVAATILQLAAEEMGLGSCWVQIRLRQHSSTTSAQHYIKQLLQIPENLEVASVISLGYPDETKRPHPQESLNYDKVFFNTYGQN
jgi:nitroreductase